MVIQAIDELKEKKKKLGTYREQIIEYFRKSNIDKEQMLTLTNKDLAVPLAEHCGSKQVKGAVGALRKRLIEMIKADTPSNEEEKQSHMKSLTMHVKDTPLQSTQREETKEEEKEDQQYSRSRSDTQLVNDEQDDDPNPEEEGKYMIKQIGSNEV